MKKEFFHSLTFGGLLQWLFSLTDENKYTENFERKSVNRKKKDNYFRFQINPEPSH
jgi:hypothetical protein